MAATLSEALARTSDRELIAAIRDSAVLTALTAVRADSFMVQEFPTFSRLIKRDTRHMLLLSVAGAIPTLGSIVSEVPTERFNQLHQWMVLSMETHPLWPTESGADAISSLMSYLVANSQHARAETLSGGWAVASMKGDSLTPQEWKMADALGNSLYRLTGQLVRGRLKLADS